MGTADLSQQGEEPLEPPICGSSPHNQEKQPEVLPDSPVPPELSIISKVAHALDTEQIASVLQTNQK